MTAMETRTMYGFPLSTILFRVIGLLFLCLCIILLFLLFSLYIGLASSILLIIYVYVGIIRYKLRFLRLRERILQHMIDQAQISGDEIILDLGTGAGYIAIGFAKKLRSGHVYGIDKYHLATDGPFSQISDEMKINFFGNTYANAKHNAELEHQQDKVTFLQSDLVKTIPFTQHTFDVIVSSQFLYCIAESERAGVLDEIDRILKPSGRAVFFESTHFFGWDIHKVMAFFQQKKYKTTLVPVSEMSNKCYLIIEKPPS